MDVSTTDNYSKTLVDYAIENNKESVIRVISEKYGQDFNFDLTKKSKHGRTMDEIIRDKWSPLVKALKHNNFEEFEESLEKVLNGEEEGLPEEDRVDSLGFTFIHSLCLVPDYLYLDSILHAWEGTPQKVKDTLFVTTIDEEMNKYHKQSGHTPITSIFSSGKKDMVDFLFSKIFLDRLVKVDLSIKDGRGRNLLHHIINNRNLDNQFKLEILNKNIAVLTEGLIVPDCKVTSSDLFNQLDDDGFSPLASFICQLTNKTQKEVTNQLILEFLIEKTNFAQTIFDVKTGALIHPFIPCIQLNLDAVYNKLLAAKPELSSTLFFCDFISGRSTLEFAFTAQNPFFIEPIIKSLEKIDSFVIHNNRITLFDVVESIFSQMKDSNVITGKEDPTKHHNEMLRLYQKLADTVYNETRISSGSQAQHILSTFQFSGDPECSKDFKIDTNMSKKMKERVEKQTQDSISKLSMIEASRRKIKDYSSLFYLAYKNNNFITLPLISNHSKDFKISTENIMRDCYLDKHHIIFALIVSKLLSSMAECKQEATSDQKDDQAKAPLTEIFQSTTELHIELCPFLLDYDTKEFYENLYQEYNKRKITGVGDCALNIIIKMFKDSKIKHDSKIFVTKVSEILKDVEMRDFGAIFDTLVQTLESTKLLITFTKEHDNRSFQSKLLKKAFF